MKKTILGCAVTAILLNAGHTVAGGLWLNEYGDFSGGRSSAGASAGVDDASTIMHNPASSTRIKDSQAFVQAFTPKAKAKAIRRCCTQLRPVYVAWQQQNATLFE